MPRERFVLLPCKISRSGFPSERVFRIQLPEGEYVGAGPVEYFSTDCQQRLGADQPKQRGASLPGYVDARVVAPTGDRRSLVSIPSGDVLEVDGSVSVEP